MYWFLNSQYSFLNRKENATCVLLAIVGQASTLGAVPACRLVFVLELGTSRVWASSAGTIRMLPLAQEHLLDSYYAFLALADEA